MANVFDQFDVQEAGTAPAGNIFDQFDVPQSTPQQSNVAAKQDMVNQQDTLGETAIGLAQAAGTGLRKGAEALIGLPGDLQSLVETGFEAGRSLFVDETPEEQAKRLAIAQSVEAPGFPTTQTIQGVTNQVAGVPREPQNRAERFVSTAAEFVPAVVAGPGSLGRKLGVATTAGVASEGAGQLTEGTAAEPFARAGGALVGGVAVAGGLNRAAKKALKSAPPEADIKKITDQLYSTLRQAGIKYNPNSFERSAQNLAIDLHSKGFRAGTAPKAFSIVDELIENVGKQLDFDDLDSIRRAAGKVLVAPDDTERAVARLVIEAIDDFALSAPILNTAGRPPAEIRQLVLRARDFASRNIKQRNINEAIEIATTRRAGFEAGLRNEFDKLLKGKKGRGWTPEERAAIKSVANGNVGRNAVRFLSKFGVDFSQLGSNASLLPGSAFGGAALAGEPLTGTAVVTVGTLARPVARMQTKLAADRAKKLVRIGKKEQQSLSQGQRAELSKTNLRRLLLLNPASQQSQVAGQ